MAKTKVKLEYIKHNYSRKVAYNKRVKGILKKTKELSVLCGIDACAIIYGPYDQNPEVWPSSDVETRRIISEYEKRPEEVQSQRQFNQKSFIAESENKAIEKLVYLQRKNREIEMENVATDIMCGKSTLQQVDPCHLTSLIYVIEEKLRIVQRLLLTVNDHNDNNNNINNNGDVNVMNPLQVKVKVKAESSSPTHSE